VKQLGPKRPQGGVELAIEVFEVSDELRDLVLALAPQARESSAYAA
jgi:hypothetical protein